MSSFLLQSSRQEPKQKKEGQEISVRESGACTPQRERGRERSLDVFFFLSPLPLFFRFFSFSLLARSRGAFRRIPKLPVSPSFLLLLFFFFLGLVLVISPNLQAKLLWLTLQVSSPSAVSSSVPVLPKGTARTLPSLHLPLSRGLAYLCLHADGLTTSRGSELMEEVLD